MLKMLVTYKRKNRENWIVEFGGESDIDRVNGLKQFLENHKSYGFTTELKPNLRYGLKCVIDTHGRGGWERESQ